MNLPLGKLKSIEECEQARPIDYLAKTDLSFSGVIRFFERGAAWNVFFLLVEEGCLIGYYATRGDSPLEEKLHSVIDGFEVEVRAFTPSEMEIARMLNEQYLFSEPLKISEILKEEVKPESKMGGIFSDAVLAEIEKARQFRENFHRRRVEETG